MTGAVKLSSEGTLQEQLDGKLEKTGDAGNVTNTFTAASSRTNLTSGEKLSVSLGKIAKYFTDLKTVAFTGKYSDLTGKPTVLTGGSQTTTSNADGGSNVYTFTKSDGTTTTLTVKNGSKGSTGATGPAGPTGATGTGIESVVQTTTSTADAGTNVITVTLTDGTELTFNVKNGSKGSTGSAGARGSLWYSGTGITGTSTTATIFSNSGVSNALVNDYYLNTSTGYVYKCTVAGAASVAKWVYVGSIKGSTGSKGATGASVTLATQTTSSDASGGKNTVTFKNSDGTTIGSVDIYNGAKGDKGDKGDTGANGTNGSNGTRGSLWYAGTAVTGTSTTGTVFSGTGISSALVNDYYLNTSTGYVYKCTTAGNASTAKWAYVASIKGATGAAGTNATTTATATSSADGLMSKEDKAKLDATNVAYGTCSTDAATAAKVVTISGNTNWKLAPGSEVVVKFSATNTAQNPTLNVNGTGAKSIWYNTALITTSNLGYAGTANRPMKFVYDGTQYVFMGWSIDNNTTYTPHGLGFGYGTCDTAEATAAKVVTLSSYALVKNGSVSVKFTNAVPANATMNINGKGAKNIYYRGAKIVAGIIKAGDIATFIYDGTQYHLLGTDNKEVNLDEIDAAFAEVFG